MTKIKKVPKNFVICDGMTSNTDFITMIFNIVGVCLGLGVIWWILHKWRVIYDYFKKPKP